MFFVSNLLSFPKLDVAGSIPVSRSIFSIIYRLSLWPEHCLNTIKKLANHKFLRVRDLPRAF